MTRKLSSVPLRFFGVRRTPGAPRIPLPRGMLCWECGQGFEPNDSGVSYERARACVVVHAVCYTRAAVRTLHRNLNSSFS